MAEKAHDSRSSPRGARTRHAQLERLDAHFAPLKRLAMTPPHRFEPAAAARAQSMTLTDLSADVLDRVISFLGSDDELAASLACRKLRDAIRPLILSSAQQARRLLTTRGRSLLVSLGKLQWGVACAGAPLGIALVADIASLGDLRMLGWLRARSCPWPPASEPDRSLRFRDGPCARAALGGHLSVLQWLHANGIPWEEYTCAEAARGGHLSVLQWARANGCPWDTGTCACAANGGHLSVLQWAHANGCPWDERTCSWAAEGGHLFMLQWARANGCEWDENTCSAAPG
jgi:hypothetical protein